MSAHANALKVDTQDPQVRRLLGLERQQKSKWASEVEIEGGPHGRELTHLAGDEDAGYQSTIRLDGGKHEVFAYYTGKHVPGEFGNGGLRLTIDVYKIDGEPIQAHLICPKCRRQLRISEERKQMRFEPDRSHAGGKLDVEPFQCTWEMPETGAHTPGLITGGLSLCKWTGVIEHKNGKNIVRDA